MTKEEYAQLNYLLAKLKYCYAEIVIVGNKDTVQNLIDDINNVQTGLLILDNKSKRQLEIGDKNYGKRN